MVKRKPIRERGKLKFSEYFKILKEGDNVSIKEERSVSSNIPKRMQGRTGKVVRKQGSNYVVNIKDLNKEKKFIVHPIHLKKVKMENKK